MRSLLKAETLITDHMAQALNKCVDLFGIYNNDQRVFLIEKVTSKDHNDEPYTANLLIVRNLCLFDALIFYMEFHYDVRHTDDNFIPPKELLKLVEKFCFKNSSDHYDGLHDLVFDGISKYRKHKKKEFDEFSKIDPWEDCEIQRAEKARGA